MIGVDQEILIGGWRKKNALASDEYGVSIAGRGREGDPLNHSGI
jgi:hypothetical protein